MATYYNLDDITTWQIVYAVLTGIFIKPLFIIWIISLCLARRKGDHARTGFTWLKVVFPFYTLALFFYVVGAVMYIVVINGSSSADDDDTLHNVYIRLGSLGSFFDQVSNALLLMTFAELGLGFLYVQSAGKRGGLHLAIRYTTLAAGILIVVLAIARLGVLNSAWSSYFDYIGGSRSGASFNYTAFSNQLLTGRQLGTAIASLLFVCAVALLALAAFVMHKVNGMPMLRNSAVIFLVAAILQFIRYVWSIAYEATWVLPNNVSMPLAINAVDPIMSVWTNFVILVLLFVIGIRKQKGLWTTQQPWMNQQVMAPPPQQGGWGQGGMYPQQQAVYQYPPQQAYGIPHGWTQQPHQGEYQHPQGGSPPYVPSPNQGTQEMANGQHGEKRAV